MSYGSRKRGLWPRGFTSFRLRRIIRRARHKHFVVVLCEQRTSDAAVSAQRLPPFVAALFFTLRDSYGWQHCRPVCSEARYSSRIAFLPTTPAFDVPVWGFPSEYCHPVWHRKTRMAWLPAGEKNFEDIFIRFDVTHKRDRHTDTQTDTAWRHRPRLCIASRGKNVSRI